MVEMISMHNLLKRRPDIKRTAAFNAFSNPPGLGGISRSVRNFPQAGIEPASHPVTLILFLTIHLRRFRSLALGLLFPCWLVA